MSCATCAIFHCGGMKNSPPSSWIEPFSNANKEDFPAPLRPTKPTFSPGLIVAFVLLSTIFVPRRSVTFLMVIMQRDYKVRWRSKIKLHWRADEYCKTKRPLRRAAYLFFC